MLTVDGVPRKQSARWARDFAPISFYHRDLSWIERKLTEVISDKVILFIRSMRIEADCPLCGASSGHVHSHHVRKPADLSVTGYRVELRVSARRASLRQLKMHGLAKLDLVPARIIRAV